MRYLLVLAILALASCATNQTSTPSVATLTDCDGNPVANVNDREPILCVARAPMYPPLAKNAGIEGVCVTSFDVDIDGRIINESVTCTPQGVFEEAALAPKKHFRYLPKLINGEPVVATGMSRRDRFEL